MPTIQQAQARYDNASPGDSGENLCAEGEHEWQFVDKAGYKKEVYACFLCETLELRHDGKHVRYIDRAECIRLTDDWQ